MRKGKNKDFQILRLMFLKYYSSQENMTLEYVQKGWNNNQN
jgi:hypothetical protein